RRGAGEAQSEPRPASRSHAVTATSCQTPDVHWNASYRTWPPHVCGLPGHTWPWVVHGVSTTIVVADGHPTAASGQADGQYHDPDAQLHESKPMTMPL